ncbi:hypothetical protein RH858_04795 [Halalkaliarchaeum sp. AArc-GB]|uniref:hypothetical protein n=1 Tax=Halalkaliarchaeum sp. AArc-GB TaxID=3074078 RepID=UPI00285DB9AC|nr:hypothetical protein [Halalkaliarchaeum sp. AArc-GB]MDR5672467.1 hypothetical protein [Halalkaliarchaeum sp. AArc-GB]
MKLEDGVTVPNAEIILSEEELEQQEVIPYSEGAFKIVEQTVNDPFDLLWDLVEGESVVGEGVNIEMLKHRPEQRFGGDREGRVFEDRPSTEVHVVFTVELSSDQEDEYNTVVNELEHRIQRAEEPYYDIAKCEYHYFDHHFRGKAKSDPEILVFAETRIEFTVSEDNVVHVVIPEEIKDQAAVSILPQRPYGTRKGWRIEFADEDLKETDDGRLKFTENPDFDEVERAYILLFVGDEILGFKDHYTRSGEGGLSVNSRYRIFDEYDQRDTLPDYLQGDNPDVFEIAVLNTLSTAGYLVQWFGESDFKIPNWSRESEGLPYDEVDLVAHRPNGSQILFVECTNKRISEKESILDRTEEIAAVIREEDPEFSDIDIMESSLRKIVPVIATPQMPEELSDQVVAELTEKGILVLDGEKLTEIYNLSAEHNDPVKIDIDREMWNLDAF